MRSQRSRSRARRCGALSFVALATGGFLSVLVPGSSCLAESVSQSSPLQGLSFGLKVEHFSRTIEATGVDPSARFTNILLSSKYAPTEFVQLYVDLGASGMVAEDWFGYGEFPTPDGYYYEEKDFRDGGNLLLRLGGCATTYDHKSNGFRFDIFGEFTRTSAASTVEFDPYYTDRVTMSCDLAITEMRVGVLPTYTGLPNGSLYGRLSLSAVTIKGSGVVESWELDWWTGDYYYERWSWKDTEKDSKLMVGGGGTYMVSPGVSLWGEIDLIPDQGIRIGATYGL